jgi:WD40 repeat protein
MKYFLKPSKFNNLNIDSNSGSIVNSGMKSNNSLKLFSTSSPSSSSSSSVPSAKMFSRLPIRKSSILPARSTYSATTLSLMMLTIASFSAVLSATAMAAAGSKREMRSPEMLAKAVSSAAAEAAKFGAAEAAKIGTTQSRLDTPDNVTSSAPSMVIENKTKKLNPEARLLIQQLVQKSPELLTRIVDGVNWGRGGGRSGPGALFVSPDMKMIFVRSMDGYSVFQVAKGPDGFKANEVFKRDGAKYYLESVQFSENGKVALIRQRNGKVSVLSAELFNPIQLGRQGGTTALIEDSVNHRAIFATENRNILVIDLINGEIIFESRGFIDPVTGAVLSPSGELLYVASGRSIVTINMISGAKGLEKDSSHKDIINDIKLSGDGKFIATSANDGQVLVHDVSRNLAIYDKFAIPKFVPKQLEFAKDSSSNLLYVAWASQAEQKVQKAQVQNAQIQLAPEVNATNATNTPNATKSSILGTTNPVNPIPAFMVTAVSLQSGEIVARSEKLPIEVTNIAPTDKPNVVAYVAKPSRGEDGDRYQMAVIGTVKLQKVR